MLVFNLSFSWVVFEDGPVLFVLRPAALMAVWSKAPPLTAHCLLPLPVFESWPGHVRKLQ